MVAVVRPPLNPGDLVLILNQSGMTLDSDGGERKVTEVGEGGSMDRGCFAAFAPRSISQTGFPLLLAEVC